jgi:hypothetical protein
MSSDDLPDGIFTPLEPPPGGLTALRARLQRERSSRWRPITGLGVAAAALAAAFLLVARRPADPPAARLVEAVVAQHYPTLVALGLAPLPAEPVTLLSPDGAPAATLRRVPVASPGIVFYLAQKTGPR